MILENWKYLGELPEGYEYKIMLQGELIKIIGIAFDKPPIGFVIVNKELKDYALDEQLLKTRRISNEHNI